MRRSLSPTAAPLSRSFISLPLSLLCFVERVAAVRENDLDEGDAQRRPPSRSRMNPHLRMTRAQILAIPSSTEAAHGHHKVHS